MWEANEPPVNVPAVVDDPCIIWFAAEVFIIPLVKVSPLSTSIVPPAIVKPLALSIVRLFTLLVGGTSKPVVLGVVSPR